MTKELGWWRYLTLVLCLTAGVRTMAIDAREYPDSPWWLGVLGSVFIALFVLLSWEWPDRK